MANAQQRTQEKIRRLEECFLAYLTGRQDENSAIECIAEGGIRGVELREILNKVYEGIERNDLSEERARSIRRRLDQNGF